MRMLGTIPNFKCTHAKWYISGSKRIAMRSGYEVAYAHYLDAMKIEWQYEPQTFFVGANRSWRGKTYTPDFYLTASKTFVEIKGRYLVRDQKKVAAFQVAYPQYKFTILVGKDFRDLVGKMFMTLGGTAPRVTAAQAQKLSVLNTRISFR